MLPEIQLFEFLLPFVHFFACNLPSENTILDIFSESKMFILTEVQTQVARKPRGIGARRFIFQSHQKKKKSAA